MTRVPRSWLLALLIVLAGAVPPVTAWLLAVPGHGVGPVAGLPFRESTSLEQWAMASAAWVIKPLYMLASLGLVMLLRRCRALDLVTLRWAMLSFFVGEAFCAVNFVVFGDDSAMSEYLHSFGMVLCFGFTTFALLEGIDSRIIRYSDATQKCAALGLCRGCAKHDVTVPCGAKRLFHFILPACLALCALPLTAVPRAVAYDSKIFWTPYTFHHPVIHQVFEVRICPTYAALFFCIAFAVLLWGRRDPVAMAKGFFAAGMGYLGFGMFRLFLFGVFNDNLCWFDFWEEATELLFICGVAVTLWAFPSVLSRDASRRAAGGDVPGDTGS